MNRPVITKGGFEISFVSKEDVTVVHLGYNDSVIFEVVVDSTTTRKVSSQEDLLNNFIGFDLITDNICVFNRRLFFKETSVDVDYSSFIRYIIFLKKFQFDQCSNEIFDSNQGITCLPHLETFIKRMAFNQDRWSPVTHSEFDNNFKSILRYMLLTVRFRSQRSDGSVLPISRIPVEVLIYKVFPFLSPFDLHVAQDSFLRLTRRVFCLNEMMKERYPLFDQFRTEMFLFGLQTPPNSSSTIISMFEDLSDDEKSLLMYEKNLFDIVLETKKLLSSGMNNIHNEWEGILRLFNIIILQSISHKSPNHDDIFDIFETTNFFDVLLTFFNKTIFEVKFQEKFEYRHMIIMMTDLFRTIFMTRRRRSVMENEEGEEIRRKNAIIHIRILEQTFFDVSVKGIIDSFLSSSSTSSKSSDTTICSSDSQHFDYELLWENTEKIKYYAVIILKLIKILRVLNKNSYLDDQLQESTQPRPPPPMKYLTGILYIMKQIQKRKYRLMMKKSFSDTLFQLHQNMSHLIFESISRMMVLGDDKKNDEIYGDVMSGIVKYFSEYIISPINGNSQSSDDNNSSNSSILSDLDPFFTNDRFYKNNNDSSRINNQHNHNKKNSCISELLLKKFFSIQRKSNKEEEEVEGEEEEEEESEDLKNIIFRTRLGNLFLRSIVRTQSYSWFHRILTHFETSWNPLTQQDEILNLFRIIYSYLNEVIDFGKEFFSPSSSNDEYNGNPYDFLLSESLWTRRFLNVIYNVIESQSFEFLKKHYFGKLVLCINAYFRTMKVKKKGNISSSDTFVVQFLEKGILAAIMKKKKKKGGEEEEEEDISIEEILELVENRNFQVWFCAMESRKNRRHFGKNVMEIISFIIERWEKTYGKEEEEEDDEEEVEEEETRSNNREIIEYLRNELEYVKNLIDVDQKIEKKSDIFIMSLQSSYDEDSEGEGKKGEKPKISLYELMKEAWGFLAKNSIDGVSDQISSLSLFNLLFKSRRENYSHDDKYNEYIPVTRSNYRIFELGRRKYPNQGLLIGLTNVCRKSLTRVGDILYDFVTCECTGDPLKELRKKKTIKLVKFILEEFGRTAKNVPLSKSEESNPFFLCGLEKWVVRTIIGMTKMASQKDGMVGEGGQGKFFSSNFATTTGNVHDESDQNVEKKYSIIRTLESVLTKCCNDDEVMSTFMNKSVFMTLFQFLQKKVIIPYLHKSSEGKLSVGVRRKKKKKKKKKSSVFFSHKELNLVLDCLRSLLHRPYLKVKSFESNEDLIASFSGVLDKIFESHCSDMKYIITEQKKELVTNNNNNKRRNNNNNMKIMSSIQKIFRSSFSYGKIIFIREYMVFLSELNERFVKIFERIIMKFITWLYELHELQIFQESIEHRINTEEKSEHDESDDDDDNNNIEGEEEEELMIVPPPMMIIQYLREFRQFLFIFLRRVFVYGRDDEIKTNVIHLLLTTTEDRRNDSIYLSFLKSLLCFFLSSSSSSSKKIKTQKEEEEEDDPIREFFSKKLVSSLLLLDQRKRRKMFFILMELIGEILETGSSSSHEEEEKEEERKKEEEDLSYSPNNSLQEQQKQEQRNYLLLVNNNNVSRLVKNNSNIQKLEMLVLSIISFLEHDDLIIISSSPVLLENVVNLTCLYKYFSLQHYDQTEQQPFTIIINKKKKKKKKFNFLDVLEKFSSLVVERISEGEKEKIDRLVDEKLLDDSFTERIDFKINLSNYIRFEYLMNKTSSSTESESSSIINNEERSTTKNKTNFFWDQSSGKRIEEIEVEYEEQEKKDFDTFWENCDDDDDEEEEKEQKNDSQMQQQQQQQNRFIRIEEVEVEYEEDEKKELDSFWKDGGESESESKSNDESDYSDFDNDDDDDDDDDNIIL